MASFRLPIGVRFGPSKLELVRNFLATRLSGQQLDADVYPQFLDYDVYTDHPFNILYSTKEKRRANDMNEGYFFSRLHKVTPNGKRISRSIKGGHGKWLEKAGTNQVCDGNKKVMGIEKYLMFIPPIGESNKEKEAEWRMHEYSLPGNNNELVLCHITRKPDSTNKAESRMHEYSFAASINNTMPMEYEAGSSSNKRGRIEYEQPPSGCNNNYPNQDYVMSGYNYQEEYCVVNQGNNDDSALIVEASVDDDDKDNNQAEDGILQLQEEAQHMKGVSVSNDTEEVFGLRSGEQHNNTSGNPDLDSWSRPGFDDAVFDDLDDLLALPTLDGLSLLLQTPFTAA